tara:strand:- start:43908 stop:44693 length:786 start_codon:yes stop_codon:yes gene_type:complete
VSLSDTLYPVREISAVGMNVQGSDGEFELTSDTGYKFIVNDDTNKIVSCMTENYQLVSNKEVMNQIEPVMKSSKAVFKEAQMFGENNARTKWTWYYPNISVEVGKDDILNPEITVQNSYDGSWELSFLAGAFRILCSNGLTIGTILDAKRNRHSIYNTDLLKIGDMVTDTVAKCEEVFVDEFSKLINTKLSKRDTARVIKRLPQQAVEPFVRYIKGHDMKNYWDLLNAFTWVTSHALNRRHQSTNKLEKEVFPLIRKMAKA